MAVPVFLVARHHLRSKSSGRLSGQCTARPSEGKKGLGRDKEKRQKTRTQTHMTERVKRLALEKEGLLLGETLHKDLHNHDNHYHASPHRAPSTHLALSDSLLFLPFLSISNINYQPKHMLPRARLPLGRWRMTHINAATSNQKWKMQLVSSRRQGMYVCVCMCGFCRSFFCSASLQLLNGTRSPLTTYVIRTLHYAGCTFSHLGWSDVPTRHPTVTL